MEHIFGKVTDLQSATLPKNEINDRYFSIDLSSPQEHLLKTQAEKEKLHNSM